MVLILTSVGGAEERVENGINSILIDSGFDFFETT